MRRSGLPGGAWVVVADGEKALFLTNVGDMEDMNLVVRKKEEHENPPTGEWAADRPGRFNDGPRHSVRRCRKPTGMNSKSSALPRTLRKCSMPRRTGTPSSTSC